MLGPRGLPGPAPYCYGPPWVGGRASQRLGGAGDGDAVFCHMYSAPHLAFRDHNAAVKVLILLCSDLDREALPAALASTCLVSAFPLLQNSLCVPHFTGLGQQQCVQPSRWLLAFLTC